MRARFVATLRDYPKCSECKYYKDNHCMLDHSKEPCPKDLWYYDMLMFIKAVNHGSERISAELEEELEYGAAIALNIFAQILLGKCPMCDGILELRENNEFRYFECKECGFILKV